MAANPVVLILGAGPRIGVSVAEKFASNGYKVAVASRSGSGTKIAKAFSPSSAAGYQWMGDAAQGDQKKTFIYTGNIMNVSIVPMPLMLDLGMGKSASAFWIGLADTMYSTRGFRFFYADERHGDSKFKGMALDGAAHGEFYGQLANHEENVPWHATFVKEKGYVQFK